MKPSGDNYQVYNYTDIFVKYFFEDNKACNCLCPEHALIFVFSGELDVCCHNHKTTIRKGEYIFLRKDTDTMLIRKACGGEIFSSVFMGFNLTFLREFYQNIIKKKLPRNKANFTTGILELPRNPYLESMYISLLPYLRCTVQPLQQVVEIKMMEAVFSLLLTDERFYSCLFDFPVAPDFVIPYNNIYRNWTISKKLETAYIKIKQPDNAVNIYMEAGYKDVFSVTRDLIPYGLISPN